MCSSMWYFLHVTNGEKENHTARIITIYSTTVQAQWTLVSMCEILQGK